MAVTPVIRTLAIVAGITGAAWFIGTQVDNWLGASDVPPAANRPPLRVRGAPLTSDGSDASWLLPHLLRGAAEVETKRVDE